MKMTPQELQGKIDSIVSHIKEIQDTRQKFITINIPLATYNKMVLRMLRKLKRKWREERRYTNITRAEFMGNLGVRK